MFSHDDHVQEYSSKVNRDSSLELELCLGSLRRQLKSCQLKTSGSISIEIRCSSRLHIERLLHSMPIFAQLIIQNVSKVAAGCSETLK
ncbi:CLUMA_CG007195, isoform A [Clunio marinus]|uniref:CLUMA_CG007195, isoform A n=1 Tax=Clunio marinus TaxID=568069 RepID=A0A1J1I1N5_9DIPT|nr:CLUMA_CG007195, isoform A [Clunio marinus]